MPEPGGFQGPYAEDLETAEHHKSDDLVIVTYCDTTEFLNVAITASYPIDKIRRLMSHDPSDHGPNRGNIPWLFGTNAHVGTVIPAPPSTAKGVAMGILRCH